jgi:Flp pilus assembly protein TadB
MDADDCNPSAPQIQCPVQSIAQHRSLTSALLGRGTRVVDTFPRTAVCYPYLGMSVLFAITVLALLALLWATGSITWHVWQVRKRRRLMQAEQLQNPPYTAPKLH